MNKLHNYRLHDNINNKYLLILSIYILDYIYKRLKIDSVVCLETKQKQKTQLFYKLFKILVFVDDDDEFWIYI